MHIENKGWEVTIEYEVGRINFLLEMQGRLEMSELSTLQTLFYKPMIWNPKLNVVFWHSYSLLGFLTFLGSIIFVDGNYIAIFLVVVDMPQILLFFDKYNRVCWIWLDASLLFSSACLFHLFFFLYWTQGGVCTPGNCRDKWILRKMSEMVYSCRGVISGVIRKSFQG